VHELGQRYLDHIARLDVEIAELDKRLRRPSKDDETAKRLQSMPGMGPITAAAIEAFAPPMATFKRGRDFAAWLGLVPKQISTGDRTILGGISRRGNRYLRTLFIQGARSVLQRSDGWEKKSFGRWLIAASKRLHKNVLAAALANKLARIAWAVLYNAREYDTALAPKAT
jgi:transposase